MKIFQKDHTDNTQLHFGASIQIKLSNQLKVCGALGNMSSKKNKSKLQGDNKIGECDTDRWHVGGFDNQSTYLFFFELSAKNKNKSEPNGTVSTIQFILRYQHSSGYHKIRVITIQKQFYQTQSPISFLDYIDQFNIISTYSKIAAFRTIE